MDILLLISLVFTKFITFLLIACWTLVETFSCTKTGNRKAASLNYFNPILYSDLSKYHS